MIIAIDTGGTKTLVTSFDKDGVMSEQFKFATPQDPNEYIVVLKKILFEKYARKQVQIIVIGAPGIIKDNIIVWDGGNLPQWKKFDIGSKLDGILDNAKILVENDANLAGLSETRFLKVTPLQSLYVTISTGIGTGIITEGHINPALRNSEAGHALIYNNTKTIHEWMSFASGKSIYKTYGKYASDITSKRVWNKIAIKISYGFLAIIPILQPDIIIIGGSIGTYFDKYGKQLRSILAEKLPPHIPCPKIIQAKNPELAVIYGCYFYAIDKLNNKTA